MVWLPGWMVRVRLRHRHRRSRMKWVLAATAPWALSVGVLVSFTAEAGNAPQFGLSTLSKQHMAEMTAANAPLPQNDIILRGLSANGVLDSQSSAVQASFRFSQPPGGDDADYAPPRADLKQSAGAFPEVDRTAKGAPLYSSPETLSRRAVDLHNASTAMRLSSVRDERALPPTVMMEGPFEAEPYELQTFQPEEEGAGDAALIVTSSTQSPIAAASGSTGSGVTVGMGDGSTPSVTRATALSSATPAPMDEMPMEISAAPVSLFAGIPAWSNDTSQPNYSALVKATNWDSEKRCLAEAVYFEARSEPPDGQAAVAQVVLNRVRSGLYPKSICGVVYQNRNRHLACQFTFACEGKALRTTESEPWSQAQRVADAVLAGKTYLADVGGATHYHADYVKPYWAKRLKRMDVIGRHIFYKLKPGQT